MVRWVSVRETVGGGYNEFWRFKGRYRAVKGGRASKKSRTTALWFIVNMMRYPDANSLVVRKTYNSLRNSCFSELIWAIRALGVGKFWKFKTSTLELRYSKGGRILFRGMDDPVKLTSITAEKGELCWIWVEEAFEISSEEDFNTLDEALRGKMGGGLFKQVTLTFNPWSENHWLKKRFFDGGGDDDDVFTLTTNHTCNEWLDEADAALFRRMKENNPKRYRVAGLGEWGIPDGLVFENWERRDFTLARIKAEKGAAHRMKTAFGLDFGYTNDPTAFCCMMVSPDDKTIYVFDEMYEYGLSNCDIYERIRSMGYAKERIYADSAEPKSIDELYSLGLRGVRKARKGKDSVGHGIQFIRGYKIVIASSCVNFLREISSYSWKENGRGVRTNTPAGAFDHLMDAMRYGLSEVSEGARWEFG